MTLERRLEKNSTYFIQRAFEEAQSPKQKLLQQQMQLERPLQKEKFQYFPEEEEIDANSVILEQRRDAIKKIESDTAELKEMFEDVNILVKLHQIPIDAISHELQETKKSAQKTEVHLLIAEERQRSRCIMM